MDFLFSLLPILALGVSGEAAAGGHSAAVRVAICQILCVDGDREGNFGRIQEAVIEAKRAGARIVCLPETVILGWVNPDAHRLACPIPGSDTIRLAEMARRYDVMLCAGVEEKDGDRLFDSAVLFNRKGEILLKHRKINTLPKLMTPPYAKGRVEDIKAVDTEFGRIGILICADTFLTEALEGMRKRRPDLVLVPYGWAAEPNEWPEHGETLRSTVSKAAKKIGAPLVGTDLIGEITHGPWTGRTYGGQSVATDAEGKVLARGKDREREILVIDVPIGNKQPPD